METTPLVMGETLNEAGAVEAGIGALVKQAVR